MTTSAATIDLPRQPQQRRTKIMRTKAQWKVLLDELDASGLTKSAFCKNHNIATSSLHKWQKYFATQSTERPRVCVYQSPSNPDQNPIF